jgi:hypothetical protein
LETRLKRIFKYFLFTVLGLFGLFLVLGVIANLSLTPKQRAKLAAEQAERDKRAAVERIADEVRAKKEAAEKAHDRALHAEIRAYVEAKDFVSRRLKAPATADFAGYSDSAVVNKGDGTYIVVSHVDAQNAFGAKIRTQYRCRVFTVDGERFILAGLTM